MPEGQPRARDWIDASTYVRRHLAVHAAAADILDDLLLDPGYLIAAYPPGLLAVLSEARSQAARRASVAYRRVAHRLADPSEPARDSYLRLAALQAGADNLLTARGTDNGQGAEGPGWRPAWAWWRPAIASRVVSELPSRALALAALVTERGPLAVVGGWFGLEVWNLDSGQRLAAHPREVLSVAVGQDGERPIVLAGHSDGLVTLHELLSLKILAHNDTAHTDNVSAAVTLDEGTIAATGDKDGALVLWRLPALEVLATRPKAHTRVEALASGTSGSVPLLISAGDTFEQGHRIPETQPVRAWTLPSLHLHTEIETAVDLSWTVGAASTPLGCIVVFSKGTDIQVKLIAADGGVKLIGTQDPGRIPGDLLIIREGGAPQIMVCSETLALLRISLQPVGALTLGPSVETGKYGAKWDGPIEVEGRAFLVSASSTLRVWDLEELVQTASQQDDFPQRQTEHQVVALAAACDVLAVLTRGGSVPRWHWRSAEPIEPLVVRSEQINTLASGALAGRPHFVVAYSDGIVEAFDAESGERWPARVEVAAPIHAMAVGEQGGRTIAAIAVQLGLKQGHPRYGVRLWDLTTERRDSDAWHHPARAACI